MCLDRENEYSDNQYTTQRDLLVHSFTVGTLRFNRGIPIQPPMVFFTDPEQVISQCVWKHKRPPMSKAILRNNGNAALGLPDFRTTLQSYSHQDSKVLAQRQKFRPMEQNRKSRGEATHPQPPYL